MNLIELDLQLTKLEKKYNELEKQYDEIEEEIEDLKSERNGITDEMNEIEEEMNSLKNEMLSTQIESLNNETDDPFIKDFITASYFCNRDYENPRPALNYVNITEDEIQGCDGYKAIIIKNINIPQELRNSLIKWDVRDNFKDNINKEIILNNKVYEYIDLHAVFPKKEDCKFKLEEVATDEFYNKLKYEGEDTRTKEDSIMLFAGFKICFRKDYLNTGLMAFQNEKFNAYANSSVSPLLLENENKSVIVLPIRMMN